MLSLSKRVDYALLSLVYLSEHRGHISSARAIAETHHLPLPLLMNLLKSLHAGKILCSERGSKGGYRLCRSLDSITLYDLIDVLEDDDSRESPVARRLSDQPPLRAVQYKMIGLLRQVRLSDLIEPGRRIDVPLEQLFGEQTNRQPSAEPVLV